MEGYFYTLWEFMNTKIVYISPKDHDSLHNSIQLYTALKSDYETLSILYYSPTVYSRNDWSSQNIILIHSQTNFEPFFLLHTLKMDVFKTITSEERKEIFETEFAHDDLIRNRLEELGTDVRNTDLYNELKNQLQSYVCSYIPDFDDFASMYSFPYSSDITPVSLVQHRVINDVYYKDKVWYDKDKQPIQIKDFEDDLDYRFFPKTHTNISKCSIVYIREPVLFLDYCDLYNCGELWNTIKRVVYSKKLSIPLFHPSELRINDIAYYLQALGHPYPSRYVYTQNQLYHFQTIHITILGGSRGTLDRWFSYTLNNLLYKEPTVPFSYKLYTKLDYCGSTMEDESSFIDELKKRNFIILNDTVTPQLERMYYIQNAELIVGIHGTLMKHSVWCRKNPLCIEFTQSLNHCIRENALGFKTMYFGTNEKQQSAFFRIIDTLFPSLF